MVVEPLTLALEPSADVLVIGRAGPGRAGCFSSGVYFAIALFHCLAPNESRGL